MLHIKIRQPLGPANYGPETTEAEAEVVARNSLALAEAFARANWPEAEIETELVEEIYDDSIVVCGDLEDEPTGDDLVEWRYIENFIADYLANHSWREELWEKDFDAASYLAAHPR